MYVCAYVFVVCVSCVYRVCTVCVYIYIIITSGDASTVVIKMGTKVSCADHALFSKVCLPLLAQLYEKVASLCICMYLSLSVCMYLSLSVVFMPASCYLRKLREKFGLLCVCVCMCVCVYVCVHKTLSLTYSPNHAFIQAAHLIEYRSTHVRMFVCVRKGESVSE